MSDSLQPHELQHARPPCPSPAPGVHPNSCPSSEWCHPAISSSVIPFSSCLQYFPAPGSFPMSQFFSLADQSIGASASVLPVNIQGWFPLGNWIDWFVFFAVQGTLKSFLQHHSSKASILQLVTLAMLISQWVLDQCLWLSSSPITFSSSFAMPARSCTHY